ncbi:MAG: hypothetical protein P8144_10540, partial [Gammaproteobacteria bacterium]
SGARISMGVFDEAQEARLKVRVQLKDHRKCLTVEHNGNKQELIVPTKSDSVFEKYQGKVTEIELQFNKTDGGSGDVQWSLKERPNNSEGAVGEATNNRSCIKAEKAKELIQKIVGGGVSCPPFENNFFTCDEVPVEKIDDIAKSFNKKYPLDEWNKLGKWKKSLYEDLERIAENEGSLEGLNLIKVKPGSLNKLKSSIPEFKGCKTEFVYNKGAYFSGDSDSSNHYKVYVDFANKHLGGGWKSDKCFAQEEWAFLENEGLASVAKYCEERGIYLRPVTDSEPAVNKEHNPNPLLIEGARRIASFNKETKMLTPINSKETVNWLAMAAPDLRDIGLVDVHDPLCDMIWHAYVSFSLTKARAKDEGKPLEINTGRWGAGVFGNDVRVSVAAQVVAANLAGVDRLNFWDYNPDEIGKGIDIKALAESVMEQMSVTGGDDSGDSSLGSQPIYRVIGKLATGITTKVFKDE